MLKKIFIPAVLIIVMIMAVMTDSTEAQYAPDEFEFKSNILISLKRGEITDELLNTLEISGKDETKAPYVVNKINSKQFVISPIEQVEGVFKINNVKEYTASNFDGPVYINNNYNLDRISKFLNDKSPGVIPYEPGTMLETSAKLDYSVKDEIAATEKSSNSKESDFSKTNVQEKGVDEGDIVKTDGKYIYYVSNDRLKVILANNGNMKIVSVIDFAKAFKHVYNVYLSDGKLIVVYSRDDYKEDGSRGQYLSGVSVYDIKDPANPKLEGSTNIKGNVMESRLIKNNLYIVSNYNFDYIYENTDLEPVIEGAQGKVIGNGFYKRPYKLNGAGENLEKMVFIPANPSASITKITAFNVSDFSRKDMSYMGYSENLYMSENSAYISYTDYNYNFVGVQRVKENNKKEDKVTSTISRFLLDSGDFKHNGTATVDGTLLNQFSLGEIEGNLFIAYNNPITGENAIASFDSNLKNIGNLKGLAKGERIYSVRFEKERAYLVTFKQVDPLFAIDISSPANMKVLGELKMPGYSEYIHPVGDGKILGVGQNTKVDDKGNVTTDGFKLSLFDVRDEKDIKILDEKIIGDASSYSLVQNDHKALMDYPEKGLIGLPVMIYKSEEVKDKTGSYTQNKPVFNGAVVYDISSEKIEEVLKITHTTGDDQKDVYFYDKSIRRLVGIGDYIYSFSDISAAGHSLKGKKQISGFDFQGEKREYLIDNVIK